MDSSTNASFPQFNALSPGIIEPCAGRFTRVGGGVQAGMGRTVPPSDVPSAQPDWQRNANPVQHAQPATAQRNSVKLTKPSSSSP